MSKVVPISEAEALREEVDQLRVQLAGCLTAAEGWGQKCYVGDYGWSPAYQAVIELRKLYEKSAQQSMHWARLTVRRRRLVLLPTSRPRRRGKAQPAAPSNANR